ncbi:MAG: LLM class flavin-dependent oxidoreductase [Acidimicrobiia bacterium]|nr:LLM class flavin-dependent oxidoreductase [Acidimicrobiia bacterium]MDX2466809.1 LLM class flavin-dependent oxidoreductase [Acidimicrobiia bacterium]
MISPQQVSIGLGVGTQPPLGRIALATRAARTARLDAIWTVDHFQGWFPQELWTREMSWTASPGATPHAYFDYQALVGYLTQKAGPLQIGIGVTEALRRHPVLLAQTAMTWAHMSKSAPILGIGAGERENTVPYGISFDRPVAQLEEALPIVRRCFEARGPFDFEGEFFHLDKAMMDLTPPPNKTPQIWIAAHGPRMLRLTGRYGDGWYPTVPMPPADYATSLAKIRDAAKNSGRDGRLIVPAAQLLVVVGRTEREARKYLDTRIMRFLALLAPAALWQRNGSDHPFGPKFRGLVDFIPSDYPVHQIDDAISKVPIDVVADNMLWGTPDVVRESLEDYVDAGLRHIVLGPASAAISRRSAVYSLRAVFSILRRVRRSGNARIGDQ